MRTIYLWREDRGPAFRGWMGALMENGVLRRLALPGTDRRAVLECLKGARRAAVEQGAPAVLRRVLDRWFREGIPGPGPEAVPEAGTPFQQRVWREVSRIPRGSTLSYGELAGRLGRPGGARAVGGAVAANPLPLLVP